MMDTITSGDNRVFETNFFESRLTYVDGILVSVSAGGEQPYEEDWPPQEELDKFW